MHDSDQLWSGRFRQPMADDALAFSGSLHVDSRLYRHDIAGSIAHVAALEQAGVLSADEAAAIRVALEDIRAELDAGSLMLDPKLEDVHMAIEAQLTERVGDLGGRLHTGRSRNDQVALDTRLYLRETIDASNAALRDLQHALLDHAERERRTIMPGYTHLQRAQPVLLAHHLLAYVEMFDRDRQRLVDCRRRANLSPLGAAAFGGTSYPIDRTIAASALVFDGIQPNSIDAVADRDAVIEFVSDCSIVMMHLSRIAEELVLWSTREFRFVEIGDAYSTGSSIMPQKKNPDMAELVRGRTGRVYGSLMALLTMMKGLPMAYNRDMQEDKPSLFDAADTTLECVNIMAAMLRQTTFNGERMRQALEEDHATATELADYLVRRGVPFRRAHAITGRAVAYCDANSKRLHDLSLEELHEFSPEINDDVYACLDPEHSIALKKTAGSTAPDQVDAALKRWREALGVRQD